MLWECAVYDGSKRKMVLIKEVWGGFVLVKCCASYTQFSIEI